MPKIIYPSADEMLVNW